LTECDLHPAPNAPPGAILYRVAFPGSCDLDPDPGSAPDPAFSGDQVFREFTDFGCFSGGREFILGTSLLWIKSYVRVWVAKRSSPRFTA
jgi:hypothetical protein